MQAKQGANRALAGEPHKRLKRYRVECAAASDDRSLPTPERFQGLIQDVGEAAKALAEERVSAPRWADCAGITANDSACRAGTEDPGKLPEYDPDEVLPVRQLYSE